MASLLRSSSLKANRRRLKQDIIDGELDVPAALEKEGFTLHRLGLREDHLFLCDLTDPITVVSAAATYRYKLPFDLTLTKIVFYLRDGAGAENDGAVNLRVNLMHPNGTPEVIYSKQGVSWPVGGERISGITYMPASELQVVVDAVDAGIVDWQLYMSLEVVVHNIA